MKNYADLSREEEKVMMQMRCIDCKILNFLALQQYLKKYQPNFQQIVTKNLKKMLLNKIIHIKWNMTLIFKCWHSWDVTIGASRAFTSECNFPNSSVCMFFFWRFKIMFIFYELIMFEWKGDF